MKWAPAGSTSIPSTQLSPATKPSIGLWLAGSGDRTPVELVTALSAANSVVFHVCDANCASLNGWMLAKLCEYGSVACFAEGHCTEAFRRVQPQSTKLLPWSTVVPPCTIEQRPNALPWCKTSNHSEPLLFKRSL